MQDVKQQKVGGAQNVLNVLAHAHERDVENAHVRRVVANCCAIVKSTGMLSEQWKGYRLACNRKSCIQPYKLTLVYHCQ